MLNPFRAFRTLNLAIARRFRLGSYFRTYRACSSTPEAVRRRGACAPSKPPNDIESKWLYKNEMSDGQLKERKVILLSASTNQRSPFCISLALSRNRRSIGPLTPRTVRSVHVSPVAVRHCSSHLLSLLSAILHWPSPILREKNTNFPSKNTHWLGFCWKRTHS